MEELFFENFSKQKHARVVTRNFGEMGGEGFLVENFNKEEKNAPLVIDVLDSSLSQVGNQNFSQKNIDYMLEMAIFLDRLEKEIEKEYADFADYRFIFNKIRSEFKKKSVNGVLELLDHLEELLDLGLPSLVLKNSLK